MAKKTETAAAEATATPTTKIGTVIALLQRKDGATLEDLNTATGWQPHSTRAALTGLRKKGHGSCQSNAKRSPPAAPRRVVRAA